MTRHIGRKQRWSQLDAKTYSSDEGKVRYEGDGWYARLEYRTVVPAERAGGTPGWLSHSRRIGPFKRPRNAMVALEREATALRNRHGKGVLVGDEVWAEV